MDLHYVFLHDVSPSILDRLIGEIVDEDETIGKTAFVSVAKDSDHPLQMVVNAFTRRGVKVYKTEGNIIHHHKNMPDREGWSALEKLNFEEKVEKPGGWRSRDQGLVQGYRTGKR